MSLLGPLNPQQREAVLQTEGPLLILAGAGSGKTRVVSTRIAHLILDKGVPPQSVLAVTFTNKAADEMRKRVVQLLAGHGATPEAMPTLSTFHSFCVRLLRGYGGPLAELRPGFTPRFLIFDEADQLAVVKRAYQDLGPDADFMKPRAALAAISRAKSRGRHPIRLRAGAAQQTLLLERVYESYRDTLVSSNALDFDDLLLESVRLLSASEEVLGRVRARYRYLLVDEFQDTNRPQYQIMKLITEPNCNVCVVGDEDQSIYSWRGADIRNILGFEADFPGARVLRLEQNYRSTARILAAASALVERNVHRKGKRLWTDSPAGDRPVLHLAADAEAEARYVVRTVGRFLDEDPTLRAGLLYRTNAQSRLLEDALRRDGRDFLLVGGVAFYQRAEVKDLLAYLKAAIAPDDAVSLRRILNVPARGIGTATLDRLQNHASKRGMSLGQAIEDTLDRRLLPARASAALRRFRQLLHSLRNKIQQDDLPTVLEWVFDETGYRRMLESSDSAEDASRLENVKELLVAAMEASDRDTTVQDFLDHAALVADSDGIDQRARILLMTLHNAKGLEFPLVAMMGLEEKLLPHRRSMEDDRALEEERRLCYVGMTRAEKHLLLTCAGKRWQYGSGKPERMLPSRFLDEIPADLLDDRARGGGTLGTDRTVAGPDMRPHTSFQSVGPRERASRSTIQVQTHDSLQAVADFFKTRGIELETEEESGSPAKPSPIARALSLTAPRQRTSRLGQALRNQGAFPRGTRVRHEKFGVGVVQRREGEGPHAKLSVYFPKHGMKKLVAGYANLREM